MTYYRMTEKLREAAERFIRRRDGEAAKAHPTDWEIAAANIDERLQWAVEEVEDEMKWGTEEDRRETDAAEAYAEAGPQASVYYCPADSDFKKALHEDRDK